MPQKPDLPRSIQVPNHIAIVLDGNRRWARAKGLSPLEGHKAAYHAMRKVVKSARKYGVHTFTFWGFSTENWERPPQETRNIMNLVRLFLKEFRQEAFKDQIRFVHLGRKDRIPSDILNGISKLETETRHFRRFLVNLAIDYGGRNEILRAIQKIIHDQTPADQINEKLFESYLDTKNQPYPYPDLFIRTSGEQRTSGLLPWQMTYTEFYWEPDHLPDFSPEKLRQAILDYSRRRRRFGSNDTVEHLKFNPQLAAKFEVAWWRIQNIPPGEKLTTFLFKHLKEQYGLSKNMATEAAKLMAEALLSGKTQNWEKAAVKLKKFYQIIKNQLQLAFEPSIVASLEMKLQQETADKSSITAATSAEETARHLYAEVYRISLFQAAKAAHLRVLATIEKNLALAGLGNHHWDKAQDYLEKFYSALKDRVA